ncbi:MAG: type II toxin-antitoxin system PemK/MazF family toxin [Mycoplasmatales bacterium]
MKRNLLKIYKLDFTKNRQSENCKIIKKVRPCLIIQASATKMYYGTTAYIAVPLSSNYYQDLENHQVEIMTNQKSHALVYNSTLVIDEQLQLWCDKAGDTLSIEPEELKAVIDKKINFNLIGGRMSLAPYKMKPYLDEVLERIEKSNEEIKKNNQEIKKDNQELKYQMKEIRKDNQELKRGNQELKRGNQELKRDNQELKKLIKN